jgi:hypothetical protein
LAQDENPWNVPSFIEMILEVDRHGLSIVGDEYEIVLFTPKQNRWIKRSVWERMGFSNAPDYEIGIQTTELGGVEGVHVFVNKIFQHLLQYYLVLPPPLSLAYIFAA